MIPPSAPRVLHHRDRIAGPWANGGGITYEVARRPAGDSAFDWRMSVAEVAGEGPFSAYPGIDRTLILLSGSMQVVLDGVQHEVERFVPISFAGEAEGHAILPSGPTMDFNIMVRRGRTRVDLQLLETGETRVHPTANVDTAVFILDGRWTAEGVEERIAAWDCVMVDTPIVLRGEGMLALVRFSGSDAV